MKSLTNVGDKLPKEQVLVKLSTCKKCNNVVCAAVLHMMDAESMKNFDQEVQKDDLNVVHLPLLQYKEVIPEFCKCYDESHLRIELDKENIKDWLKILDSISMHLVGVDEKLSETQDESWWLEIYEGCTPLEAVEDEEWEQGQN